MSEFYNFFFNRPVEMSLSQFLNGSSCDEMGDIDLVTGECKIIYHVNGKYYVPVQTGNYNILYQYLSSNIVHPNDVSIYQDLMNPDTMIQKLKESFTPNFRTAEFRYKLENGEDYRWVEQCIITGQENGIPEGVVRFYVFDVQNRKSREEGIIQDEKQIQYQDRNSLTRLFNEKAFFVNAEKAIKNREDDNWCFVSIDIEHFRLFDEWYGRDQGNILIGNIGLLISKLEKSYNAIGGYMGQDDFAIFMPYNLRVINQLYDNIRSLTMSFGQSVGFMPAFGISFVDDAEDIVSGYDHASIACFYAKRDIKNKIYTYDSTMHNKSEKEYKTLISFIDALKNGEVTFYLQPQCRISSSKIVGAESLARWIKNGEIISPIDFIPILEKYGFITDLDKYIWEEVCKWIRDWIDRGNSPIPVSVNISQIDLFSIDVSRRLINLIEKYHLNPSLLKIEITESAYAENSQQVIDIVKRLRDYGFTVMMDDFGSGYSSLNMLNSLNVDIIKLDARFLNLEKNDFSKSIHILESIINMAKVISIPLIVEGVETKDQINFLESMGVRYVQGYYFYKAMDVKRFEELISDTNNVDKRGFVIKTNQQFSLREFLDQNIYSDAMLNNIIGAFAFYSWHGNDIDIVRYNQQFYESVGVSEINSRLKSIQDFMSEEDTKRMYEVLTKAKENRLSGEKGIFRFSRLDGSYMWYDIHFYYIDTKGEEDRFYGAAHDLTDYYDLYHKLSLISSYTHDSIIFLSSEYSNWSFTVASHGLEKVIGINKEQFEEEINNRKFYERVLEDRDKFRDLVLKAFSKKEDFSFTFSIIGSNNEKIQLLMDGTYINDDTKNISYVIDMRLK